MVIIFKALTEVGILSVHDFIIKIPYMDNNILFLKAFFPITE